MQDSGSGKSTPKDIMIEFATKLGLIVEPNLIIQSDAFMAGSFSQEMDNKGKLQNKRVHGILETADLIFWDEGEVLFKETGYSKYLLNLIDATLNPIGSKSSYIKVGLKGALMDNVDDEEKGFQPHCTLAITSYEIKNVVSHILHKGAFQRLYFYPRHLSRETRWNNIDRGIDNLGNNFDYQTKLSQIATYVADVSDEYKGGISVDFNHVKPTIRLCMKRYHQTMLEHSVTDVKTIMDEFVSRYLIKLSGLSIHRMMLDKRETPIKSDVIYADSILMDMMNKQLLFLERKIQVKQADMEKIWLRDIAVCYNTVLKKFPKSFSDGWVTVGSLRDELVKKWRCSDQTYYARLKQLGKERVFEEEFRGQVKYVKLAYNTDIYNVT
jgi:hypothetical protein